MKFDRSWLVFVPALLATAAPLFVAPGGATGAAQAAVPAYSPRGSLCAVGEVVLFHCAIGRKMVSVCGDRRTTPHAQYRFGVPGDLELAVPGPGESGLSYAREMYSGGGALQIRFARGGYDYAVYSRTIRTGFRGRNNPQFSDGVMIRQGGRLVSNRACTSAVRADGDPADFMPEGTILDW
jgi:hypothetical protein